MLKTLSIWICGHDLAKYHPGLGQNSFGYWRLLIPYCGRFYNPSCTHDLWYSFGGNEEDRRLADCIFYAECLALSKNFLSKFFSGIYYKLLRKYGYKYFRYEN